MIPKNQMQGLPLMRRARVGAAARGIVAPALVACIIFACSPLSRAADAGTPTPAAVPANDRFAIHGQFSYVEQETDSFSAPYAGPNSLSPHIGRETIDATLYLGARLWSGAEAWINGEVDQGFGLNNTLGVAGFPSGTDYKVGKKMPYLRLPRAFVRQTLDLDGEEGRVEAGANQFAAAVSQNRWVFTVGKFSVTDVFDTNQYAHDPRADFLNWAVVDAGTFDYAADAWGYSVGASAEWYQGRWALREGLFDLSDVPNSTHLEHGGHEFQMLMEIERRHELFGHPGRLLITVFNSRGRMARLDQAVQFAEAAGAPVDPAAVRQYRSRMGVHLSLEQPLTDELALFARAGSAGGNVETYEFTDIDRSLAAGLSLKGSQWHRAQDTVGLAGVINKISAVREQYLDAGGLGVLIGDGQLPHPGPELIGETYYSVALYPGVQLSLDYQWISHPAYNRDRGPVSVVAVRVHAQF
jgi:high affinity Mn2+ porin